MNVGEITQAILTLAEDKKKRIQMGENGYRRVSKFYRIEKMIHSYGKLYKDFAVSKNLQWVERSGEMLPMQSNDDIGEV